MLKQLFLFFGILLVAIPLKAQHDIYIGARGSFHVSTASLTHTIFATSAPITQLLNGGGGLLVKFFPKPHFGLQLELNYTQKGFEQLLTDTNEVFETEFNYLEIPFMFNLYLGKRKTQYFANLGPYFAILMDNKTTGPQGSTSEQLDFFYDPDRDNKSSVGIKFAAGVFREFSFGGLQVDGFLTADISNFLDPVDLSSGVPDSSKNFVFGGSLAYLIPLGNKFEVPDK